MEKQLRAANAFAHNHQEGSRRWHHHVHLDRAHHWTRKSVDSTFIWDK